MITLLALAYHHTVMDSQVYGSFDSVNGHIIGKGLLHFHCKEASEERFNRSITDLSRPITRGEPIGYR